MQSSVAFYVLVFVSVIDQDLARTIRFDGWVDVFVEQLVSLFHVRDDDSYVFLQHTLSIVLNMKNATLVTMFTRVWVVDGYFAQLSTMILPESTHFIALIDSDDEILIEKVQKHVKKMAKKFTSVKILTSGRPQPPKDDVVSRRSRIAANWARIIKLIRTPVVFSIEDDTLCEPDALLVLARNLKNKVAFSQGVQVARWGTPYIPAWHISYTKGHPIVAQTSYYQKSGIENIDAGGFYCFAAKTEVFKRGTLAVDDYLPLGVDVRFVASLRALGYLAVHDWSVTCGHITKTKIIWPDEQCVALKFFRLHGQWFCHHKVKGLDQ